MSTASRRSGLAARDDALAELMDDPACDPARLHATLQRFGTVNRIVSGWGTVYRTRLLPALHELGRPARVLDVGSGGGDLVVRLAGLARRDGLDVQWVGVDPDERAQAVALRRDAPPNISYRHADAATLVAAGERFDAVVSNHVLHHLGADLPAFFDDTLALSDGPVLHSDIARSRTAYGLYAVGITPFAAGTFLRTDGLRSIRRSFTADELHDAASAAHPGRWRVHRPVPFRLVAEAHGRA